MSFGQAEVENTILDLGQLMNSEPEADEEEVQRQKMQFKSIRFRRDKAW